MSVEPVDPNAPVVSLKPQSTGERSSEKSDLWNVVRGFCMGAADTVPGVSGGTVALILGHYQRLVNAISCVDRVFLAHLCRLRFLDALRHVDGRFLFALAVGITLGIVSLAGAMHWLLEHQMSATLALFMGLVAVSVWIVRREVQAWSIARYTALIIGIGVAVGITMLSPRVAVMSLPYLFFSASIAICAMILPGISGAFILLLMGTYYPVTGMIKSTLKGDVSVEAVTQMSVFSIGCLFGLLAFSRLLKRLLRDHRDTTMAGLVGLMIGSIGKLWPYQTVTPETADLEFKFREFVYQAPTAFAAENVKIVLSFLVGVAVVLGAERLAGGRSQEALPDR